MINSSYRSTAVILPRNCMIMCECKFKFKCAVDTTSVRRRRRLHLDGLLLPNAKRKKRKKLQWWEEFFLEEDGNWFGWKDDHDDLSHDLDDDDDDMDSPSSSSSSSKFEDWKRRAEAITELREAQQDFANQESRQWQDWLRLDDISNGNGNGSDWEQETPPPTKNTNGDESSSIMNFDGDDLLYKDRVFRYASLNSAKFLAILILVPWASDFLIHDYALMPFLDRYVKKVPLAAQILDVRRDQKLVIVQQLKLEQARLRLEVEIGKLPPLSDDQLWSDLRHKAIELRDERRLENRSAFANIWSDMVFGVSLFLLLYCNQNQVALLKFTGYKIINNISDTGKAFLIILVTDIFLGYHSESGWQTLVEMFVEHYGLQVDQASITIFICLVPVILDACVKLWMFKFLPRLSPKVANIFREMKRH